MTPGRSRVRFVGRHRTQYVIAIGAANTDVDKLVNRPGECRAGEDR